MKTPTTLEVVGKAWAEASKSHRYYWLTAENVVAIIKAYYSREDANIENAVGPLNTSTVNRCLGLFYPTIDMYNRRNQTGMFRATRDIDGISQSYYFATNPGLSPPEPLRIERMRLILKEKHIHTQRRGRKLDHVEMNFILPLIQKKRIEKHQQEDNNSRSNQLRALGYWDSSEAKALFLNHKNDERNVLEVLNARIEKLRAVSMSENGWMDVADVAELPSLGTDKIFKLQQRCQLLCLAYIHARDHMNGWSWSRGCCGKAVESLSRRGIGVGVKPSAVARWNLEFKQNEKLSVCRKRKAKDDKEKAMGQNKKVKGDNEEVVDALYHMREQCE